MSACPAPPRPCRRPLCRRQPGNASFRRRHQRLSIGNSGLSGKLFGGYQLNPNFAVEGSGRPRPDQRRRRFHCRTAVCRCRGIPGPLNESWSLLEQPGRARQHRHVNGDDSGAAEARSGRRIRAEQSVALRGEYENYHVTAFDSHPNIGQYSFCVRVNF
jgi:OOP family OmpA-OmpF porin